MKGSSPRLPVVFIGHGSPMNAVQDNDFTQMLAQLGQRLPRPRAILCVSAHWMTEGTWVTHMERPKTIHDFYGFPQELFDVQYPAPADPKLAEEISSLISKPRINLDNEQWGYDHGTWSVLRHMYPQADIPLLQLSLSMAQDGAYHFELGKELRMLRDRGVLIIGSGNIVHNLRTINWNTHAPAFPWATEFDAWTKQKIEARDFAPLVSEVMNHPGGKLSVPTWDHYYPLLYILGASHEGEKVHFEYEGIHNASISMRCLTFGHVAG